MVDVQKAKIDNTYQFNPRTTSNFWFARVDIDVIRDETLSICDKIVFAVICSHANVQTRACPLRVKTIAKEANCSARSVQNSLKALVTRGVIERTERFEHGKQKASNYTITGHNAPCYKGVESAPLAKITSQMGADFTPTPKLCTGPGAENAVLSLQELIINDIDDIYHSERGVNPRDREENGFFKKDPYAGCYL